MQRFTLTPSFTPRERILGRSLAALLWVASAAALVFLAAWSIQPVTLA